MDNRTVLLPLHWRRFNLAGYLLGFALGGFFDGILLHQILQWHHLLSGIERAPFGDLRVQILADGLFHAAMYVIAAVGIWKLLQARYVLPNRSADRLLAANALIGFGAWHVVDAVVSHWILGLHRIRMDVPNPLYWDLLWFAVFGVAFIAAGIALRRGGPPSSDGDENRRKPRSALAPVLIVAVTGAALTSMLTPADSGRTATVTVLLRPGASPVQLLASLQEVDGRVMWNSAQGEVWVFALNERASRLKLYAHGALFVSGTLLPAGCSAWQRI